ncbi:MAG: Ig-like domain-containing protein, partial [Pseudomonadota bacterium]
TATVFVDVGDQPNRAPIAEDNATETDENNPVTFNILTNDTDPDGDPIEVNAVRDSGGNLIPFDTPTDLPEGGTITVSRDGTVTFDPDGDFEALGDNPAPEPAVEGLGLTYTVLEDTDEGLVSNSADITIGIRGVNDAPVARDDDFGTDEDTGISGNVLSDNGNSADSDVDADDTISVTAVNGVPASVGAQITLASGALLTLNADGTFDYDPNDGFESLGTGDTASDGFMYTLSDATGASSVASVTIAITGVNDAPVATDFDVTTDEDTPVTLAMDANVSDAEGDMLSFEFDVNPALGAVTFEDGAFVFTPTLNTNGPVEIGYTVTDEDDASDTGTIMVDVAAVNDAPVAVDDAFTVLQGTGVLFDLVANDTDVDGDTLSVLSVGVAANGLATANGYTPNDGFFGVDTFTYVVSDGIGGTDIGTVTITVTEEIVPNSPPVPGDVSVNLSEDDATDTIDLLAGATDPDEGDILSVVGAIASADDGRDLTGIVSISGSEVTVTPAGNFEALNVGESVEITISYSISDGTVSVPTTATLTVNGVNDAPVLDPAGPFDVAENTTAVATLTASDIDNTDLLYTVSGGADAAQFDINDDGELVFVSAPDFEDPDDVDDNNIYEVEVTVSDGDLTDSQVLSVTVTDVDDTDPVLNEVFGTNGSDRSVVGTDGDDIINSLAGRSDKITGLDGADIFDFSTSSDNGARETRRITDFDADEGDTLLLADGVSITRIRESRGDTQIYLDGDRDVIILEDVSGFGTDSLF